ncbi:histidine phosphatase family protein [Spirillospora sp. CA-142024]|uniref:histidine phosphatase family protein n=1 Tax=Spirillospora sp. CA-142024 TaxID=3240036 RepID=UPI003D936098
MILLIRHGQSEQNAAAETPGAARAPSGRRRDWALTERGRRQAEARGRWLRATAGDAAVLHSSPYARALATAEAFGLGWPDRMEELADRDWAAWFEGGEGPEERGALARRLASDDPWGWRPPGGESLLDLRARMSVYLRSLSATGRPDRPPIVIAVSHGEPILAMRAVMEGIPLRGTLRRRQGKSGHGLPNCGVLAYSRVDPETPGRRLPAYRWRGHLVDPDHAATGWNALSWTDLGETASSSDAGADDGGAPGDA